jgi:hypothetical protein
MSPVRDADAIALDQDLVRGEARVDLDARRLDAPPATSRC